MVSLSNQAPINLKLKDFQTSNKKAGHLSVARPGFALDCAFRVSDYGVVVSPCCVPGRV